MRKNFFVAIFFVCFSLLNADNLRNLDPCTVSYVKAENLRYESNKLNFKLLWGMKLLLMKVHIL